MAHAGAWVILHMCHTPDAMTAMDDAAKQNPSTEELDELDTIIRVGIKKLQEEVERHGDRLDLETVVTIT